jgi:hypothetical protein
MSMLEEISVLPRTWDIPKTVRKRLGDQPGRQRAIFEEGHLLLVLRQPPKPGTAIRPGRYFWRNPGGVWTSSDLGDGPGVLGRHLGDYSEAIHQYDQQEERAHSAAEYFTVIDALAPLVRSTTHLHQVLQDARKLVPEDRGLINYRDQSYELERTADLLYTAAKNGLEFEIARRAEEEARSSRQMATSAHRLNILAAFFFPLATLSGVLGMGLQNARADLPGLITVVVVGLLIGVILTFFITRRSRGGNERKY